MNDFRKLALQYIEQGFSVIPVDALKQPTINWTKYQTTPMSETEVGKYFKNVHGMALICGGSSKVTCVDIDLKYDTTGNLVDRLKEKLPESLLRKMWVQKTPSGGLHWVFKCSVVEHNQKLANRLTTPEEKHITYTEAFNNIRTRPMALKIASNDKVKVLLETRENGGYFLLAPTKGYEKVYGKLREITPEEREMLFEACRSFNEYMEPSKNYKLTKYADRDVNPFENYNERGDSLGLLIDNGWEIVSENGHNVRMRRPGSPDSKSSALFDKDTRIFNVFSTSTVFEPNVGYTPVNVFIKIECDDDTQLAYEKLVEQGFGENV